MGLYDDVVEIPRRTMILFFVVDTSGSMQGSKIGTVNAAIEEIIPELKDISETNADAQIKVATLAFSRGAKWIQSEPVPVERFRWDYLEAEGVTDLGAACTELNQKLSKNQFMSDATGSFAPAIFLLSDGEPTDNYREQLSLLKENNWFKKAIKVAIAIGDEANKLVLSEFTGSEESVVTVYNSSTLKKWVQFVSVRASKVGSKNSKISNTTAEEDWNNSDNSSTNSLTNNGSLITSKQEEFIKEMQFQVIDSINWDNFDSDNVDDQW